MHPLGVEIRERRRIMEHVTCSACREDVVPRPPSRAFWSVIVSFWVFSLLFGVGAFLTGWGLMMMLAWLFMACSVGVMAQRVTSYTCPECGSAVTPPVSASPAAAGGRRVMTPA
jgi:hypothetical protein